MLETYTHTMHTIYFTYTEREETKKGASEKVETCSGRSRRSLCALSESDEATESRLGSPRLRSSNEMKCERASESASAVRASLLPSLLPQGVAY